MLNSVHKYRVTIQLVANLLLTSKLKFRFGLAWPSQAKAEHLFCSQREVRHKLNGHPVYALSNIQPRSYFIIAGQICTTCTLICSEQSYIICLRRVRAKSVNVISSNHELHSALQCLVRHLRISCEDHEF